MLDFPKQYKQTKIASPSLGTSKKISKGISNPSFVWFPYPLSSPLHMGHIFRLAIIDFLYCYHRLSGENLSMGSYSYYGTFSSKGISRSNVFKQKQQTEKLISSLGLSGLLDQEHSTLSEYFSSRVKTIFSQLVSQGYIQNTYELVYRSNENQSPLAFDDVVFKPMPSKLYTIRYFVSTKNNSIDLNAASPETIFGDVAIAIHPNHKKAKQLKGQSIIIPIVNKTIPIIIDERADFARNGGIMRVTPGHDKVSLAIAKDHNLPLDVYAVDESGYFTEHAGIFAHKKMEEFLDNIIQNISDIGNLVESKSYSYDIPFSKKTDEKLTLRTWNGRFFHIPEHTIISFFDDPQNTYYQEGRSYITNSYRAVSGTQKQGLPLPVRKNSEETTLLIDENTIIEAYAQQKKKKQNLLLGILIFHLISEKKLSSVFSPDTFIEAVCGPSFQKEKSVFDQYITFFKQRYPTYKEDIALLEKLASGFTSLDKTKPYEATIDLLFSGLSAAFGIVEKGQGNYSFDFSILNKELSVYTQSDQTFESNFLTIILLLESIHIFDTPHIQEKPSFLFGAEQFGQGLRCSLLGYILCGEIPWKTSISLPYLMDKKGKKYNQSSPAEVSISSLIKTYGSDCLRLALLIPNNEHTYTYDETIIMRSNESISTFWNACRYIKSTSLSKNILGPFSFSQIQKKIQKNIADCNAFDGWILAKAKDMLTEFQETTSPQSLGAFGKKIFTYIKHDFSEKYVELIKTTPSEISDYISIFVIGIFLKLTFPYIPSIAQTLWNLMDFEGTVNDGLPTISFDTLQKNYLISLFMELVDKFSSMKSALHLKKHDPVSIFLRSNQDFIRFTKSNEHLLKKTLHADEIIYFTHNEKHPSGYSIEEIIDITIGLKSFAVPTPNSLHSLQKKLEDEQAYLQHLRSIIQSLTGNGSDQMLIDEKKKEITVIKKHIDDLTVEISKLKMKG